MSSKPIFFTLCCIFCIPAFSQITFQKRYGAYPEKQAGMSIEQTFDGGYIVVGGKGFANDIHPFLLKLDMNGDTVWSRKFTYPNWIGMYGLFFDVHQLADSGFIMSGYIGDSIGSCLFVRTDKNGDTLWIRDCPDSLGEKATSINLTTDGGFITGSVSPNDTLKDHFNIIKLDSFGNISWTKPFYLEHIRNGFIFETSDHGFAIIGSSKENYVYPLNNRMFLAKLDSSGDSLWTKKYFILSSSGFSGQQTNDGGFIICGSETTEPNAYVVKADSNGDTLWTKMYGVNSLDAVVLRSIRQTQDLGYIISGTVDSVVSTESDALLIKIDSSGNQQWANSYTMLQMEYGQCVRETSDGGFVIGGSTDDFVNYNTEVLVIKTDAFGNLLIGIPENNSTDGYSIYPNPSTGTFQIKCPNPEDVKEIVILDAVGKELQTISKISGPKISINLNNKPGIYYVKILEKAGISVSKVILLSN